MEETVYKERTAGGDIKVQAEEELDYAGRQCMDGIGGKPHSEAACDGGKPTHPHNSEKAGIEEDDDEYAGPSSLQYDVFHDGGRGE